MKIEAMPARDASAVIAASGPPQETCINPNPGLATMHPIASGRTRG